MILHPELTAYYYYPVPHISVSDRYQSSPKMLQAVDNESVSPKSEKGIDYTYLRYLLANGKWKNADEETDRLLRKVANQKELLSYFDWQKFPCTDLRTIDRLWVKYSGGKFGFSVQRRIWESVGKNSDRPESVAEDAYKVFETWQRFAAQVGWLREGQTIDSKDLTFNLEQAKQGHLPFWMEIFYIHFPREFDGVISRTKTCQL